MRAKILIVDDDPDILLSLQNRVSFMGHDPLTATNGRDALRAIQEEEPDLVLLDLELPLLSGLDVLKQVSETSISQNAPDQDTSQNAATYTTPLIVMLTAYGTIERAVQAMQLGAFDFVPKPFTSDHLTVVIKKALDTVTLYRQVATLRKEVDVQFEPALTTNKQMSAQLAISQTSRRFTRHRVVARRDRNRQRSGGPRHSSMESSFGQAVCRRQLCGIPREFAGERALWS